MRENEILVKQVLDGNDLAFERLIRKFQKLVSHIVFRMVSNPTDREDLCQDVFIKVYKNLSGFRFDSKLSTWIARIAYNRCINFLEKKKVALYDDLGEDDKQYELKDTDSDRPDQIIENADLKQLLAQEIDTLPIQYRTIITLYHLDEMSYTEIADIMGLPEGTVKSYLFRARKQLREKLEAKYQREDIWK